MSDIVIKILYMISCIFFIRGIKLLGKTATARKGNLYSAIGMLVAVVTVLAQKDVLSAWSSPEMSKAFGIAETSAAATILNNGYIWIAVAVLLGTVIGAIKKSPDDRNAGTGCSFQRFWWSFFTSGCFDTVHCKSKR